MQLADYLTKDVIKAINYARKKYPNTDYPVYKDPKLKPLIKFRKEAGQLKENELEIMYNEYVKTHGVVSIEDKLNFIRCARIDGIKVKKALHMIGKSQSWYQRMRDKRGHLN